MNVTATEWLRALGADDDARLRHRLRHRVREAEHMRTAGRVLSVRAVAGRVEGRVQGSHARPHHVELGVPEWTSEQWRTVGDLLAHQARHYARLLAGQLPEQFDQALRALGLSLVPRPSEWRLACTCTEPVPCRHQIALWLQVRARLDDDPYLLTRVRGRGREQLLAEIRNQRAVDSRDRLGFDAFAARGWLRTGMQPTEVPLPPVKASRASAGPLRMLGNPPGWAGPTTAAALFAPAVEAAARRAQALLADADAPADEG